LPLEVAQVEQAKMVLASPDPPNDNHLGRDGSDPSPWSGHPYCRSAQDEHICDLNHWLHLIERY